MSDSLEKKSYLSLKNDKKTIKLNIHRLIPPCKPVKEPELKENFENIPVFERIFDTLLYSIKYLEYIISPNGDIRQWLFFNINLFLVILIPCIFFIPLLNYLANATNEITHLFLISSFHLLLITLTLIATTSIIFIAYRLFNSNIILFFILIIAVIIVIFIVTYNKIEILDIYTNIIKSLFKFDIQSIVSQLNWL